MISPQIGEQFTEPVFGANPETLAVIICGISAAFFCWFLYQEHKLNQATSRSMINLQQKMYEHAVVSNLEQRWGE
jgi:hypothetical protein